MPLILFFNTMFGRPPPAAQLAPRGSCTFTTDRTRLAEADAVIFHLPDVGAISDVPKYAGQLWVAWSMESTVTCPMLDIAPIMATFDVRMTYERRADIWCPYLLSSMATIAEGPIAPKRASAPAVMFQSSPYDACGRTEFAMRLMRRLRVDSFGRLLRNKRRFRRDRGTQTKLETIARYKFCLAFENSIAPDYVTEKFFEPLLAGTVPVYRGAPNVDDFAPGPKAFINAASFESPEGLGDHLVRVARDEAAYAEYFEWRTAGPSEAFRRLLARTEAEPFDCLAALVAERAARNAAPRGAPFYPLRWLTSATGHP